MSRKSDGSHWVKISQNLTTDERIRESGENERTFVVRGDIPVYALCVGGISFCRQHQTDGYLSRTALRGLFLATFEDLDSFDGIVEMALSVGLLEYRSDLKKYYLPEYTKLNETAAEIKKRSESAAKAAHARHKGRTSNKGGVSHE